MKLFAIYVGGDVPGGHVEVHDVRFVAATAIEETYEALRRQWWGTPKSLHVDSWTEVSCADGHAVSLRPEPFEGPEKLWFVNLGGYEAGEFGERHRNVFVVAGNERQAKARALRRIAGWLDPHRDEIYEADKIFALETLPGEQRLHVHLAPAEGTGDPQFVCAFVPIGKG